MAYEQYSEDAYTGSVESVKNRISSNSYSSKSEDIQWPLKLDLWTNKENTSSTYFTVTESYATSDIDESNRLYLNHRPAVDVSGDIQSIVVSHGVINTGLVDIFTKSVVFSTRPTTEDVYVTYTAAADKIEDSHINSLQNAVMAMQDALGVKTPVTGVGTGLITLPIVTTVNDIGTNTELQALQDFLPNIVLLRHLQEDFYVMSTNNPDLPAQNVTLWFGNTGTVTRDDMVMDFDHITVQATNTDGDNGTPSGNFVYSSNTGDFIGFSGMTTFASQVTIGTDYGALITGFDDSFPDEAAGAFVSGAALRVFGGLWFGNDLSGNGNVTFIAKTGEAVVVQGDFEATTLQVDGQSNFDGPVGVNNNVTVNNPGSIITNSNIALNNTPAGTPTKIDGLDPSYAQASLEHLPVIKSSITQSVRHGLTEDQTGVGSQNSKFHPQLGMVMYPLIGGWTFTGKVNFEKASIGKHENVILLETDMIAVGDNFPNGAGYNLGGGSVPYGSYCTGLFNPGDTFIEFDLSVGNNNNYSFPIYYHTAEGYNGGALTGLNVYIAADDDVFEDTTTLANKTYRLYQPGNVPLDHLRADSDTSFSSSTQPVVLLGNQNTAYYPNQDIKFVTDQSWDGGSSVTRQYPLHKKISAGGTVSVNLKDCFEKSIDGVTPSAGSPQTGVAYVYATSRIGELVTQEDAIQLRATPTPYGLASKQVWKNGFDIRPGQHCPVGEVWASTTNGTSWTLVEVASYRPDGFYDSGWIPMVEYRSAASSITSIPENIGRCLPILGSASPAEFASSDDNHNFFVEHNLGPLRGGMTEIECKVWVASYKTGPYEIAQYSEYGDTRIYKGTAAGDMNLWTPYRAPYNTTHDFYQSFTNSRGLLREISHLAHVRMVDSRFAMISIDDSTQLEAHDYIRVYITRNR